MMGRRLKLSLFAFVLAAAFLAGYGTASRAWPGVPDRDRWHGYFTNVQDTMGDSVLAGGYPSSVNTANEFINYTLNQLRNGSTQNRTGAAFIIQIMLGSANGWSRNRPPNAQEIAEWEAGVRYLESRGLISWNNNFSYSVNSYWQGCCGGGSNPHDDAYYYENGTRISMVFRNPDGTIAAVIKRDCANPLTSNTGMRIPWSATGRTTVNNAASAMAVPGETVTFRHYVRNAGPNAAQIWWATFQSPSGTGVASGGPNSYAPGQEINVSNQNFTIPANAAANTRYCRLVGWDPANSSGGRNGRGTPACVTVFIPAKIKAIMTVNPTNAAAGETVTFTPGVTVRSTGNPVTINCTITRVATPPTGAAQNLGNPACVDSSGNTNIVVTGGGVTLRANPYVVADNLPVGTRVCDTMTITNPTLAAYYQNPATDRVATACVTVAKTPYVHFNGNDVFAGGNFASVSAACNNRADITTVGRTLSDGSGAGSVGEYGVFALGRVTGFGSSSKTITGSGSLGAAGRALTFANNEANATLLGDFGLPQYCINDYSSLYGSLPTIGGGAFNIGTRGSGQWRVMGSASFSGQMGGPSGGIGQQQVYYVQGDVTITGTGVTYPATYASASAIPSLVIISTGNIYVSPTVTQMDGIFVARGNGVANGVFYTCWPKNEPASTANPCNASQLVVNGSVIAGRVDLFRSFGGSGASAAQRKDPAERFQFSPEIYIKNVLTSSSRTTIETTNVLELPPRF